MIAAPQVEIFEQFMTNFVGIALLLHPDSDFKNFSVHDILGFLIKQTCQSLVVNHFELMFLMLCNQKFDLGHSKVIKITSSVFLIVETAFNGSLYTANLIYVITLLNEYCDMSQMTVLMWYKIIV